jgi:hypothetical protein
VKEFTRAREGDRVPERAAQGLTGVAGRLDRVHALAIVLGLGLTTYLAAEPTPSWLLLLLCVLSGLAADNVVRSHPKSSFRRFEDTALFLFVPVLFTLGAGLFLEEMAGGHLALGLGLVSAAAYWAILRAEYEMVDRGAPGFQTARLVLNSATYVIAFLFFATVYDFGLSLPTSALAVGVISMLLAIEVLREEGMETDRTVLHAAAIGALMAQAAWVTHFLPLDGSAPAVFLLVAFYLMTGMMHNYLANRLNLRTVGEFTVIALACVVTVAAVQAYV